jgi:uncharacterized protein
MDNVKSTNKKPLKFFLLVFALSIPLWIIDTMIHVKTSLMDFSIIDILATFIPIIDANILVYREEGYSGNKTLFKRIFDFERIIKKSWYLPIIFLPCFLYFLIFKVFLFLGLPLADNFQIHLNLFHFCLILFLEELYVKKRATWANA